MSSVAVRPPRFLGERVPTREQTTQERLQESLGAGWTIEPTDSGFVARAPPVEYVAEKDTRTKMIRRGQEYRKATYIPKEYTIGPSGEVLTETTRGIFTSDTSKRGYTQEPFVSSFTDYPKQFQETSGTRTMAKGRETVRTTSRTEGGMRKDFRIIHQDSKEYELSKRTEEQAKLIREEGFLVRRTEKYAIAGMSEPQREKYYKLKAQQRSAELSMDAKAQKVARDVTWQFQKELQAESSKYVRDIVQKQGKIQEPNKPPSFQMYVPVEKAPEQGFRFEPTPISKTTRTDMGSKPFLVGGKLAPGVLREADKPSGVIAKGERMQDVLSLKSSRARAQGKDVSGYGYALAEFGASVPIGAVKLGYSLLPQNLPETVGNMFNPESYRQAGQELATRPTKFAGETTGALLASYGIGKGIQAVQAKFADIKSQRQGPSSGGGAEPPGKDFQRRLSEEGIDIVNKDRLDFLKTKEGKGEKTATVFGSKRVLTDEGRIVETPSIQKLRDEIPGNPSRLGTIYGEQAGKPIKVAKDIETTLRRPQIVATSKWLPGDVRRVVVQNGVPYIEDMWGGQFRPYTSRPNIGANIKSGASIYTSDEFQLSTIYEGGLAPSQKATLGFQQLSYVKEVPSQYGPLVIDTKPGPTTQKTLYPTEIVIKKVTPSTGPTIPAGESIPSNKPATDFIMGGESKSVLVQEAKPAQRYSTAGEVLEGTLKVYPKYQLVESKPTTQNPVSFMPSEVPTKSQSVNLGMIGLAQFPKGSQRQEATLMSEFSPIQREEVQPRQSGMMSQTPISDIIVKPEMISASRSEARAEVVSIQQPASINILKLTPELTTETVTETQLQTELRMDLITESEIVTTPRTNFKLGPPEIVKTPPSEPFEFRPTPEGKEKKSGKYEVQVREKGIFKTISVASSPQEAFRFGQKKVEQTASASLRIKNIGGSGDVLSIGRSILPKKSFYESKKEPGVFIQRREKRISSPGEKREITFKGLMVKKSRSIFG